MIKILSIEPYRKESTQIKVELSSGDIYVIGFLGLVPVSNSDTYSNVLKDILNDFETIPDSDLNSYLSYRMACLKLEEPLYVIKDSNKERERIGRRIREIRSSLKMEAKTLARLSQIDAANLSRIEQGKYSVGLDVLCKIATALNSRVEIIPSNYNYEVGKGSSIPRKLWVIPTGETAYDPICTVPACGYSLWPNTYNESFEIGDIIVFYLSNRRAYSAPYLISDTNISKNKLGEDSIYANNWPDSANNRYLKVNYRQFPDVDIIKIHEIIEQAIEGEPSNILMIKL